MSTTLDERWCNHCRETIGHTCQDVNHLLHLILTILTGGVWLIVWIVLLMMQPWRIAVCMRCGTVYSRPRRTLDYAAWHTKPPA